MSGKVKVYETSIGKLEPIRNQKTIANSLQIEVVHILIFIALIIFMLGGAWKATKGKSSKEA